MSEIETFDTVIVGGGPSGATAAWDLARKGRSVLLLDRAGRTKPCGGAIPPRLIKDFDIPDHLLVARITSARMVSPKNARVDIPIDGGFVGMVDRDTFDEWLRVRAVTAGATRRKGMFSEFSRADDGTAVITYRARSDDGATHSVSVRARTVIGADGALSAVAKQAVPKAGRPKYVFAYHEIIRAPRKAETAPNFDSRRCDVIYDGATSPDFYSWIFPHGDTVSVGTGSAVKGFDMKDAVHKVRAANGLAASETIRKEGAPLPLKPLRKWDNGRDVILAGDAAGVVAPASGEGIYYAMLGGRLSADAVEACLVTGQGRELAQARRRFMKLHGRVFWVLGVLQYFWYHSDKRRESFVAMCRDKDVQRLTFEAYMNKELVRTQPMAHVRIFFKDLGALMGLVKA